MIIEIIVLAIVALIMLVLFFFFRKALYFIVNSVIGLLALFGFNGLFGAGISINFWTILISGIGGSIGFVVIVMLHYLGLVF